MGSRCRLAPLTVLVALLLAVLTGCDRGQRLEFVVEQEGQALGRVEVRLRPVAADSSRQEIATELEATLSALGESFELRLEERIVIDPRTGLARSIERRSRLGDLEVAARLTSDADSVRIVAPDGGRLHVARAPDLLLEDGLHFAFLLRGLAAARPDTTWSYRGVDLDRGRILDVVAHREPSTTLTAPEGTRQAAVVRLAYPGIDAVRRLWIDPASGLLLESLGGDGVRLRRGGLAPGQRRETVMLDSLILAPVAVRIEDPGRIRRLRLRAVIDTPGIVIDPAELQQPGQRFAGEVRGSHIEGVFELAYPPYDGRGAPSFPPPPEAYADPSLRPYLQPEAFIESDDPDLVALARRLTAGSADCWEAVRRLARWVDTEIGYAVPGGGTAAATLAQRRGECGSHSRLLAGFCRAVGIPARMVIGGTYFVADQPYFGQHGWTEIHLGEAGWIPLDATLGQTEVLGSGHIRLGEIAAFQPESVEILEHELAASAP
jgi:transglutaminase-like putative cysteine protease